MGTTYNVTELINFNYKNHNKVPNGEDVQKTENDDEKQVEWGVRFTPMKNPYSNDMGNVPDVLLWVFNFFFFSLLLA